MEYKVTACSMTGSQRIERVVYAASIDAVLRAVGPELHDAGYYPVSIVRPIVLPAKEAC
jgi:hypothetical protein